MSARSRLLTACALSVQLLCAGEAALADSNRSAPPAFFALPMELDLDNGASNGDAIILRVLPLYTLPVMESWKLVHLDLLTFADSPGGIPGRPGNPEPEGGERVAGIGDLMHVSLYTPSGSGDFVWGIGAMLGVPTASNGQLGSGKWTAGPAFRLTFRNGPWNLSMLGGQRWTFAGDSERENVNQLMLRGAINRQLANDWYFVSAPIITANWNSDGQKWLIPLGGGIGRQFEIDGDPWAWSVQGYYNAVKPDGAPNWSVRFSLITAIPLD